jgi:hypothetical protein
MKSRLDLKHTSGASLLHYDLDNTKIGPGWLNILISREVSEDLEIRFVESPIEFGTAELSKQVVSTSRQRKKAFVPG